MMAKIRHNYTLFKNFFNNLFVQFLKNFKFYLGFLKYYVSQNPKNCFLFLSIMTVCGTMLLRDFHKIKLSQQEIAAQKAQDAQKAALDAAFEARLCAMEQKTDYIYSFFDLSAWINFFTNSSYTKIVKDSSNVVIQAAQDVCTKTYVTYTGDPYTWTFYSVVVSLCLIVLVIDVNARYKHYVDALAAVDASDVNIAPEYEITPEGDVIESLHNFEHLFAVTDYIAVLAANFEVICFYTAIFSGLASVILIEIYG